MLALVWKFIYENPVAITSLVVAILGSDYLRGKIFSGAGIVRTRASAHPILTILISLIIGGLITFLCTSPINLAPIGSPDGISNGEAPTLRLPSTVGVQIILGLVVGIIVYIVIYWVLTVIKVILNYSVSFIKSLINPPAHLE